MGLSNTLNCSVPWTGYFAGCFAVGFSLMGEFGIGFYFHHLSFCGPRPLSLVAIFSRIKWYKRSGEKPRVAGPIPSPSMVSVRSRSCHLSRCYFPGLQFFPSFFKNCFICQQLRFEFWGEMRILCMFCQLSIGYLVCLWLSGSGRR